MCRDANVADLLHLYLAKMMMGGGGGGGGSKSAWVTTSKQPSSLTRLELYHLRASSDWAKSTYTQNVAIMADSSQHF